MKNLYTIYDSIAGFYSPVFTAENDAHATRMMNQSIDLNHKADFTLWSPGQFNSENGEIKTNKSNRLVEKGQNLKEQI